MTAKAIENLYPVYPVFIYQNWRKIMITFDLDTNVLFGYSSQIVQSLMPVVYIVAGIGLGFVIVNRIISAFR